MANHAPRLYRSSLLAALLLAAPATAWADDVNDTDEPQRPLYGLAILAGAIVGYMAWSALDVTVSSLRGTSRVHDNSKRSPQPVHEPSTPAAPPTASVSACFIDRSRG